MFGLEILDLLIGLLTVYLVFGLACTAIVEAIAAWCDVRSANLEAAMNEFLAGDLKQAQTFVQAFYDHPLVQALSKGKEGRPSYIPAETVGRVIEAIVTANGAMGSLAEAVKALPGTVENNRIKGLLDALVSQVEGDAVAFRKTVETHFNAVMDRASGWFKRRQQTVGLIVSAVLVLGANVDTVELVTALAVSADARARMVTIASQLQSPDNDNGDQLKIDLHATHGLAAVAEANKESKAARDVVEAANAIARSAGLPIGWKGWWTGERTVGEILAKLTGLLISIFAVSLGAPFWFDLLQRFMHVRTTGSREVTDESKRK